MTALSPKTLKVGNGTRAECGEDPCLLARALMQVGFVHGEQDDLGFFWHV